MVYERLPRRIILFSLIMTVLTAWGVWLYYHLHLETVYRLYADGRHVGTVQHPDLVDRWLREHLGHLQEEYPDLEISIATPLDFEAEQVYKPELETERVKKALIEQLAVEVQAVELLVEGRSIGYAPHREAALEAIHHAAADLVEPEVLLALEETQPEKARVAVASVNEEKEGDRDEAEVVEAYIKEEIRFEQELIDPDQLTDQEDLVQRLSTPRKSQRKYTVKEGDALASIASQFNLSVDQLLDLNPELDEADILSIGQEVIVQEEEPALTVVSVEEVDQEEAIPYQVETKRDPNLYRGQSRVEQEGVEGKKRVRYQLVKENGVEVSRKVVEEEVLEEPVNKIVVRGEKVKPSRGDGQFAWPTRGGRISSGFGPRWGRSHNGIDISGAADRTILAADHGTVVKAGWHSGGYGNVVIINHHNGYRTLYAHLSSSHVKAGQTVERGEPIGVMGSTGRSTGLHLHFEIHRNGKPVNPLSYLRR